VGQGARTLHPGRHHGAPATSPVTARGYLDAVTFVPKGPRRPARFRIRIMINGVRRVQTFSSKLEAERARNQLRARTSPADATDTTTSQPFLAIGEPRRALDRLSLRKRLWAACDAAGLPRRGGLGWLRHEAATLLRERGESLQKVGQGMGHTSARVVAAHYDESDRRAAEEWRTRRELGARLDRLVPVNRGHTIAKPARSEDAKDRPSGQNRQ
jgi:integrase